MPILICLISQNRGVIQNNQAKISLNKSSTELVQMLLVGNTRSVSSSRRTNSLEPTRLEREIRVNRTAT
jgi:hypothetical protein